MIRFLEHRVGDRRIIRLIQKWLKAGVREDRTLTVSETGTGQGSVISPGDRLRAQADARRFLDMMRQRFAQFALSLHPEKTRLIEFGRYAPHNREQRGLGKPETFDFLGFTLICGKAVGAFSSSSGRPGVIAAGETPGNQGGAAAATRPSHTPTKAMASASRQGVLRLPCRADRHTGPRGVQTPCH